MNLKTLETLLSLSLKEKQTCLKNLGSYTQEKIIQEKIFIEILDKQHEIIRNWQYKITTGVSSFDYLNYSLFCLHIEKSVCLQKEIIAEAVKNEDIAKKLYQKFHQKYESFEKLKKRELFLIQKRENKIEQKNNDEFCINQYYRNQED